jgi:predicted membrane chloride channel (bestrophin family)
MTRHTARFLSAWLLLLPLALWEPFAHTWNHVGLIPTSTFISFFFFGIEELAVQLEEPFSILPMKALTDGIMLSGEEFVNWHMIEREKVTSKK